MDGGEGVSQQWIPIDHLQLRTINGGGGNWGNCSIFTQFYDQERLDRWRNRGTTCGSGDSDGGEIWRRERERSAAAEAEREQMFEKVVTPSDVGKLNRLVIPKQHAERHFPLDSSTGDKGMLLGFEDCSGKSWRFRYSYWRSSQSYVITKGWSRFVKDKNLHAGDTVSFHRSHGRLFIDWRRRPFHPSAAANPTAQNRRLYLTSSNYHPYRYESVAGLLGRKYPYNNTGCEESVVLESVPGLLGRKYPYYNTGCEESVPVVEGKGRKLRLFGVNMECGEVGGMDDGDVIAVSGDGHRHSFN